MGTLPDSKVDITLKKVKPTRCRQSHAYEYGKAPKYKAEHSSNKHYYLQVKTTKRAQDGRALAL